MASALAANHVVAVLVVTFVRVEADLTGIKRGAINPVGGLHYKEANARPVSQRCLIELRFTLADFVPRTTSFACAGSDLYLFRAGYGGGWVRLQTAGDEIADYRQQRHNDHQHQPVVVSFRGLRKLFSFLFPMVTFPMCLVTHKSSVIPLY